MYKYLERELIEVSVFCNQRDIASKIILETCKRDYECLEKICKIDLKTMPACLEMSTGTSFSGAEIEKVRFRKEILEDKVRIKAEGASGHI